MANKIISIDIKNNEDLLVALNVLFSAGFVWFNYIRRGIEPTQMFNYHNFKGEIVITAWDDGDIDHIDKYNNEDNSIEKFLSFCENNDLRILITCQKYY